MLNVQDGIGEVEWRRSTSANQISESDFLDKIRQIDRISEDIREITASIEDIADRIYGAEPMGPKTSDAGQGIGHMAAMESGLNAARESVQRLRHQSSRLANL